MSSHQRVFYIDALKVFAMVLVVLGHLAQFSPFQDTFYSSFVGAPDKPCGVGRADANPKLLLNDT